LSNIGFDRETEQLNCVLARGRSVFMKKNTVFVPAPFSKAEFIPVVGLQFSTLALVIWAFFVAGDGLTSDQRQIVGRLFALLAGASGFFFGGVVLKLSGRLGPGASFVIRALSGAALFLIVLVLPLIAHTASHELCQNPVVTEPTEEVLQVTSPAGSDEVGPTAEVRGRTTHPRWFHYLVVTGLTSGGDVVQDNNTIKVSPNGDLYSLAIFGAAAVGVGQRYSIRFVDSKTAIEPGRPMLPGPHVIVSPAVTVTRTR
jgi:hypothetical protein